MHMHKPVYFYFWFEIWHHRVPRPWFLILRGNSGNLQTFKVEIGIFMFAWFFRTFWSKMAVLEGKIRERVVQCWPPNELLILGVVTSAPLLVKNDQEMRPWEWGQTDWHMPWQWQTTPHHNRFTALFPGRTGWAGARRELLDFMVQREINRGRHTDHPAGRHSIRTNQCPPPPSPYIFTGQMTFLLPNQQCQSIEGSDKLDL